MLISIFLCYSTVVSPKEAVATKISPPTHFPANTVQSISPPLTSPPPAYPAVLVGRSSSESKAKVPPPVPPRGTQKVKRGESNGKGARCLPHNVADVTRLHADVHLPQSYANSIYLSPCFRPYASSTEYFLPYAPRKIQTGSFTELVASNGYYYGAMRSNTSFSEDNEIEYFV